MIQSFISGRGLVVNVLIGITKECSSSDFLDGNIYRGVRGLQYFICGQGFVGLRIIYYPQGHERHTIVYISKMEQ